MFATGALLAVLLTTNARLGGEDPPIRLGLPAYGYPGLTDLWAQVAQLPPGSVVILDPADGPGTAPDPRYQQAVAAARLGGTAIYGYVDTAYGTRATADMLADVGHHIDWYGVTGIFLDQTPGPMSPAVEALFPALRAAGLAVAVNPGQPLIDRAWVEQVDHVVTFEGTVDSYRALKLPAWMREFPTDKFWHLVYGVASASDALVQIRRAVALRAGLVYVTDGVMPNPWERLPRYWAEELAALTPVPTTTASTVPPTAPPPPTTVPPPTTLVPTTSTVATTPTTTPTSASTTTTTPSPGPAPNLVPRAGLELVGPSEPGQGAGASGSDGAVRLDPAPSTTAA